MGHNRTRKTAFAPLAGEHCFTAMMFYRLLVSCLLLLGMANQLHAATTNFLTLEQEKKWASQRDAYRNALQLLQKGQRDQFRAEAAKLKHYALYPDLVFREYSRYMGSLSKKEVHQFLKDYGDTSLATRLRLQWLHALADRKDWETYLEEYRPGQYAAKYDCYYYWAQYQVGNRREAFAGARKLWLVGKSQDDACTPLFGVWATTNKIDGPLAWERMALAMEADQLQLATHLETYLPANQKPIAKEWREIYRDPTRLKDTARYRAWGSKAKPLIRTGLSRLVRRNADLALQLWPIYEKSLGFNPDEKSQILKDLAFVVGANYADSADYWLAQALQHDDNHTLAPLAARNALRKKDWARLRALLALIEQTPADAAEWRYWAARANEHIPALQLEQPLPAGQPKRPSLLDTRYNPLAGLRHREQFFDLLPDSVLKSRFADPAPRTEFKALAGERTYYGFLSSERLHQPLNLRATTTQITEEMLRYVSQRPGVQRSRELYLLDEIYGSRLEWHYTINQMNEQERGAAAYLAWIWGWNNQAIMAAARSSAFDNLDIRFPLAHKSTIMRHAKHYDVEPDWVYAVIRQESAFLNNARSPVGAQGMMQIMPATAKLLARQMKIPTPSVADLAMPEQNIRMGTFYLRHLLDEFDGNMILATASYNAGPHRAKAWQPRYGSMEGDIWVDTIPFRETREYVKNILSYQAIYRHHLGRKVALNPAIVAIPPRRPADTAQR